MALRHEWKHRIDTAGLLALRARLGALLYGVDGVENYAVVPPAADVAAADDVLPVLGTLTVEAMP